MAEPIDLSRMGNLFSRFKQGDKVRVLSPSHAGEIGVVHLAARFDTRYGTYEMIWVKLPGEKIEGFKPDKLEWVAESENA